MLYYFIYSLERKNTCYQKSKISLLSTSTIYFHISDLFSHILGRLNFVDRKFCETYREKPNSSNIVKYNPSKN